MPDSANKVLHEITQAGLLSSDHVTRYDREVETGVDALLKRLIDEGHITDYQADKFRAGLASDISFGDYLVLDKLGQGGMGTVLLARHRRMDRKVAIKILPVTVLESAAAVARFYQEVKVAAQLTHPNIVHAYDAGEQNGFHYLVMEYVPGHDLANVLFQLGPLPLSLAIDYILQAAQGLDYAHRKGVVHRDIKPSNLLLDDEGVVKVLDMGLARIGGNTIGDSQASMHLTTTGQVMGTVEYMSPEQAEDTRLADARSDIYSLGCTLYRLISGKSHFARDTVVKTILAHRDSDRPDLREEFRGLVDDRAASELNRILRKMIAIAPDERYSSTSIMIEELSTFRDQLDAGFESESSPDPPGSISADMQTVNRLPDDAPSGVSPNSTSAAQDIPVISPSHAGQSTYKGPSYTAPGFISPPVPEASSTPASTPEITYIRERGTDTNVKPPSSGSQVVPRYGSAIPKGFVAPVTKANPFGKQHRAKRLLLLSAISLLLAGCVIGAVPGVITWVTAGSDLEEMSAGRRNPAGYNLTKAAKILAILSIVVSIISLIGGFPFIRISS